MLCIGNVECTATAHWYVPVFPLLSVPLGVHNVTNPYLIYHVCPKPLTASSYGPLTSCLCVSDNNFAFHRCNFCLLSVGGALYAVGGQTLQNMEFYIPAQDAWTPMSPLPETLAEFSACESHRKIYLVGGYTPWGKCRTTLPVGCRQIIASQFDG